MPKSPLYLPTSASKALIVLRSWTLSSTCCSGSALPRSSFSTLVKLVHPRQSSLRSPHSPHFRFFTVISQSHQVSSVISPPPTPASNDSVGPEDPLTHNGPILDQAAWKAHIQGKRSYAKYTSELVERGGGPGWSDYLRRRLLRLAEAELEEQSWALQDPLPEETRMADGCFKLAVATLVARKEILASAQLMEDWIRFGLELKRESWLLLIPTDLLSDIITRLSEAVTGHGTTQVPDYQRYCTALQGIWDACSKASIGCSASRNLVFGTAFQKASMWSDAMDVLTAELNRLRRARQGLENLTGLPEETCTGELDDDHATALELLKGTASYLRTSRPSILRRISLRSERDTADHQVALVEHISVLASTARLLSSGLITFQEKKLEVIFCDLLQHLCSATQLSTVASTDAVHLGPPLRRQIRRHMQTIRDALTKYTRQIFGNQHRGASSSKPSTSSQHQQPEEVFRHKQATEAALLSLVKFAFRHLSSSVDLMEEILNGLPELVDGGGRMARALLTDSLNQAILAREPKLEQRLLRMIYQQEGVPPPDSSTNVDDGEERGFRRPFLLLIDQVMRAGDAHRITVLLRYISVGGRIFAGVGVGFVDYPPADDERRPFHPGQLVRTLLPSLPRPFDPSRPPTLSEREIGVLLNSAVSLALLNIAVKAGAQRLAGDLFHCALWLRRHHPHSQEGISLEEASCYFQSLEKTGDSLLTQLRNLIAEQGADILHRPKRRPYSDRSQVEESREIVGDLFDVRSQAKGVYEDLMDAWRSAERCRKPPQLDSRFYNAVLGAMLWPFLLGTSFSRFTIQEVDDHLESAQEGQQQYKAQPSGAAAYFSFSRPKKRLPTKTRLRRDKITAMYADLKGLFDDSDGLNHLVVILSDMISCGLKIPPGYEGLLERGGYEGEVLYSIVEGEAERRGKDLKLGKLAQYKDRGRIISHYGFAKIRRARAMPSGHDHK